MSFSFTWKKSLSSNVARRRWKRFVLIMRIWYNNAQLFSSWIVISLNHEPSFGFEVRGIAIQLVPESFFIISTGRRNVSHLPQDSEPILSQIAVRQISHSLKNIFPSFISKSFLWLFHLSNSLSIKLLL